VASLLRKITWATRDKLREAIVEGKEKLVPDVEKAISTLAKSLEGYKEDPE